MRTFKITGKFHDIYCTPEHRAEELGSPSLTEGESVEVIEIIPDTITISRDQFRAYAFSISKGQNIKIMELDLFGPSPNKTL